MKLKFALGNENKFSLSNSHQWPTVKMPMARQINK